MLDIKKVFEPSLNISGKWFDTHIYVLKIDM